MRIGIDVGESTIILTGWDIHYTETDEFSKKGDKSKNNGNYENTFGNNNSKKEEV